MHGEDVRPTRDHRPLGTPPGLARRLDGELPGSARRRHRRRPPLLDRTLEIGTEAGIPDTLVFDAIMRIWTFVDGGSPSKSWTAGARRPNSLALLRRQSLSTGAARDPRRQPRRGPSAADEAGRHRSRRGARPADPPTLGSRTPRSAYVDAALGEASTWTGAAYDLIAVARTVRRQHHVARPDRDRTRRDRSARRARRRPRRAARHRARSNQKTTMPLYALYARLWGACGLRTRDGPGDCARAARARHEAIVIGDRIGAGIAVPAAQHFPALRD